MVIPRWRLLRSRGKRRSGLIARGFLLALTGRAICGYGDPQNHGRGLAVAKSELGTKRIDPETGRKFYDLNKDPIVSPYTGKS